jgi:DNA-directed RNA polymerase specialized sigma24 family protein
MSSTGSVTLWIGRLQSGDPLAAQQLWERYFRRLVGLARQRLLDSLGDDSLRSVALRKMARHSNDEIAARLGCAPRTVARKLRRIRTLWSQEALG